MAVASEAQFHVLAVDDSLVDRKLIERLLKSSSFQVTTVDSGSKALELLGLQQPHQQHQHQQPNSPSVSSYHQEIEVSLVITDYCMPGMTGYDLLKKIKESSSLKDIPVVIMSSENVPSRINRCLEEGADEFLLKPVKLSDVKKLRPHIMKGKSKEQQQEPHQQQLSQPNQHQQPLVQPSSEPETQESQKEQCMQLQQSIHHHHQPQEHQMKEQKQVQAVQPPQQHLKQGSQNGSVSSTTTTTTPTTPSKPASGTKRKAMDSEASTTSPDERPRPNYKVKGYGLTVV